MRRRRRRLVCAADQFATATVGAAAGTGAATGTTAVWILHRSSCNTLEDSHD
jgi:hypothetical protein